ncbi:hypothetical protein GUITHDRAFT_101728 [Guillardia theta CCMP2712]|uniref:Uncharacterized protein n=1 Tax=Guillardia theta (strain CCMP2712) TaxID=905079 RepID=L1JVE7_GUITC|nr:hypothetical protein GUITHDRAFT_101728 [Guillardia theta CCMP2712]EKX52561.1 hypothetical protein GUITHDRAFT_101728 [Guillardia theta CCMP2712]|eukprot:XP_005839541.1 hypothetical protein GUITHDRAFT_101728 [Guillardia theta CCMP2712]
MGTSYLKDNRQDILLQQNLGPEHLGESEPTKCLADETEVFQRLCISGCCTRKDMNIDQSEDFIRLSTTDSLSAKIETLDPARQELAERHDSLPGRSDRGEGSLRRTPSMSRLVRSKSVSNFPSVQDLQRAVAEEAGGKDLSLPTGSAALNPPNLRIQRLKSLGFKSLPSSSSAQYLNASPPTTPHDSCPGTPTAALERQSSSGEESMTLKPSLSPDAEPSKVGRRASASSTSSPELKELKSVQSEASAGEKARRSSDKVKRELKANDDCFYVDRDGGIVPAKVVRVDQSIDPPGFEVYMISRNRFVVTERFRLLKVSEATAYMERRKQSKQGRSEDQ